MSEPVNWSLIAVLVAVVLGAAAIAFRGHLRPRRFPHRIPPHIRAMIIDLGDEGYSWEDIKRAAGVSRSTVGRVLKQEKVERRQASLSPLAGLLHEQAELLTAIKVIETVYEGWRPLRRRLGLDRGRRRIGQNSTEV